MLAELPDRLTTVVHGFSQSLSMNTGIAILNRLRLLPFKWTHFISFESTYS